MSISRSGKYVRGELGGTETHIDTYWSCSGHFKNAIFQIIQVLAALTNYSMFITLVPDEVPKIELA